MSNCTFKGLVTFAEAKRRVRSLRKQKHSRTVKVFVHAIVELPTDVGTAYQMPDTFALGRSQAIEWLTKREEWAKRKEDEGKGVPLVMLTEWPGMVFLG